MSPAAIDPILLGHNPFFGVNHLSQEQGAASAERFEDQRQIAEVLLHCHELGVRGMMMSTHPRAAAVCEIIGREQRLASEWRVYPLVPYLQKYVREANEKGLVSMVTDILAQATVMQKLSLIFAGGRGLLTRDVQQGLTTLIDIELLPCSGRRLGAVFLHDALTDLALGLGAEAALEIFRDHVEKKYRVRAGFATKNLPLLRERLEARGWTDLLAMASFNAAGFYVNPSLEACAAAVAKPGMTFVAMNTLASGALAPEAAYRFLAGYPGVSSVVVGMSRKEHAAETVSMIRRHLPLLH